jgi:N-hydroxyarylamine O-acetyltransferase
VTLFNPSAFDLRAYLHRIGVDQRPSRADLATLQELALLHPCAIAFENLDPLLRRPVRLDIAAIQDKLVRGGRGGWCFEHNLLLGTALAAIGYEVSGLSARVVWNVAPGVVRGRSHMVLHVTLDGVSYIVDVGFGGSTPTAPLKLVEGLEQTTPHEPFRLMPVSRGFLLEAKLEGTWKGLYSFDQQPQVLGDYEIPNWYLCNHPESHFLDRVVAARVDRDRRYALRNTDFAIHFPHGVTERRVLGGAAEIRQVLTDTFCINVPAGPEVDDIFERLAGSAPVTT